VTHTAPIVKNFQGMTIDCGTIKTTLSGIQDQYPDVVYTPATRELYVYGYERYHVDEFPLVYNSCITLYFNGLARDSGCRNSTVFRAKISNPCVNTDIMT